MTYPSPSNTARAWISLDRRALAHNVKALRSLLPDGCVLMPAVKANAYGHGALLIARELERMGIDRFCVATAQEGVELREGGVTGELLVLGWTHPDLAPLLASCRLTQTVPDREYARSLCGRGVRLRVHLKLDTGMNRLGEPWDRAEELLPLFSLPDLEITGIFTHLCTASDPSPEGRAFALEQGRSFEAALAALRSRGCSVPPAHILSSGGLLRCPQLGGSFARVGIALYGAPEHMDAALCPIELRPVLSLSARVAQVRTLRTGERAGYDLKFTAQRPTRLAVLSIGYADGLPRSLSQGVGSVLLRGRSAPIAGLICMDQTLIDVTDIPGVSPGDEAVLIGCSGDRELTACDLARQAGTIPNELLSRLGPRLERRLV